MSEARYGATSYRLNSGHASAGDCPPNAPEQELDTVLRILKDNTNTISEQHDLLCSISDRLFGSIPATDAAKETNHIYPTGAIGDIRTVLTAQTAALDNIQVILERLLTL